MGIFQTYAKRKKQVEAQGKRDVYQYTNLPEPFRNQVIHIWVTAITQYVERNPDEFIGGPSPYSSNRDWRTMHDLLARELGVFSLGEQHRNPFVQCQQFLHSADTDDALSLIELTFRWIDKVIRRLNPHEAEMRGITQHPDDAIEELNHRFREHNLGYQFAGGNIIKVDSEFLHAEVIKPTISLLEHEGFDGPVDEFLRAHEHYRCARYKEAVAEALKSFESTMKAICEARKWDYPSTATAKPLIDILLKNGLIPAELESGFNALRSAMESGLPTLSNRTSRHGQGKDPKPIPSYFAAYALHLAASDIVFLVEAHRATK